MGNTVYANEELKITFEVSKYNRVREFRKMTTENDN